jgi:hypothetical protein
MTDTHQVDTGYTRCIKHLQSLIARHVENITRSRTVGNFQTSTWYDTQTLMTYWLYRAVHCQIERRQNDDKYGY